MNIKEITNHLKQLNEHPSELLQNTDADLYALEKGGWKIVYQDNGALVCNWLP